jgi:hypothetical protein
MTALGDLPSQLPMGRNSVSCRVRRPLIRDGAHDAGTAPQPGHAQRRSRRTLASGSESRWHWPRRPLLRWRASVWRLRPRGTATWHKAACCSAAGRQPQVAASRSSAVGGPLGRRAPWPSSMVSQQPYEQCRARRRLAAFRSACEPVRTGCFRPLLGLFLRNVVTATPAHESIGAGANTWPPLHIARPVACVHGFNNGTPLASKCLTLRVTTVAPSTRPVAAMSASR